MSPTLAFADRIALAGYPVPGDPLAEQTAPHWLRLSMPSSWARAVETDADPRPDERAAAWYERLGPIGRDLRHFLMAYSAALLATAAFIA